MCVISAAAVFLTCSPQHVVDALAVASLGTYIYIYIYVNIYILFSSI